MHVRGAWPAMPYTFLYSVHHYWWKRQVSHQRWIWGIRWAQARKHRMQGNPPWLWNPGQTPPEVQNRGIGGPTKKDLLSYKIFFKKKEVPNQFNFDAWFSKTTCLLVIICPFHELKPISISLFEYVLTWTLKLFVCCNWLQLWLLLKLYCNAWIAWGVPIA